MSIRVLFFFLLSFTLKGREDITEKGSATSSSLGSLSEFESCQFRCRLGSCQMAMPRQLRQFSFSFEFRVSPEVWIKISILMGLHKMAFGSIEIELIEMLKENFHGFHPLYLVFVAK